MSNFLAIATVTTVLSQSLQAAATAAVPGATTGMVRPGSNGTPDPGINIFLYQATRNPTLCNQHLPTRREDGTLVRRSQVALDLYYLLSFYGDDASLEPQRLLGSAVSRLESRPTLTRSQVQAVIDASTSGDPAHFLAGSDLADQVELVRFSPVGMDLEEFSRLWSVFFQTSYVLSTAYQASVVLIESDESPQEALPVLARNVFVAAGAQPAITSVEAAAGPRQSIVLGSTVIVRGRNLRGDAARVRIGGSEVEPEAVTPNTARVTLSVPPFAVSDLRAGVRGLRVVHHPAAGPSGGESNIVPFVLRPTITSADVDNVTGTGSDPRSADITVTLTPELGTGQRASLLLNQNATTPAAYSFRLGPAESDTTAVVFHVEGVRAGEYFVRIQVDGAESPVDLDPSSPEFGPLVAVP